MSDELASAVRSVDPAPSDESSFIARLLDSESRHVPRPEYIRLCRNRPDLLTSRQDSINAILQAHAHFGFKPVTAFLSIIYFDRFLSAHTLLETGWPFRLLLVACLSLAAKIEEMYVPTLLELQMPEPTATYIFEPETIQRMELLVLAKLKWNLRSVTPFDYLHYFISMLPSSSTSESDSASTVHSLASVIVLNTTRVIDFMGFPPSTVAAAAVICAAGDGVNLPDTYDERISREMVRSCHRLIDEYLVDTCPSKALSIEPVAPPSPMGVLDAAACASCESQPEIPGSAGDVAEPENKHQTSPTPDVQET